MKRKLAFIAAFAIILACCAGCQLANPEQTVAGDELIGTYITTESLYNEEDLFLAMFDDTVASQEAEEKIYGTFDEETDTLTFPDITGHPLFLVTEYENDAPYHHIVTDASDRHTHVIASDTDSGSTEISGTFYYDVSRLPKEYYSEEPNEEYANLAGVTMTTEEYEDGTIEYVYTTPGEDTILYCNPIYRTPNGEYYITPSTGLHLSAGDCSQSLSNETTDSTGRSTDTKGFKVTAYFKEIIPTKTILFTATDSEGTPMKEDCYQADTLPETYAFPDDCEYIFVTLTNAQGDTRYDIINKDDEDYSVYFGTEHIFCKESYIEITH